MKRNCSLKGICVGFISVFVCVFRLWSFFVIFLKELFSGCLFLWIMVPWRGKSLIFHHVALTIISLLYCWVDIQESLILVMALIRYLIFDRVCINTSEYCFMGVLTLIWYIMAVKFIAKISVDDGFNLGKGCLYVYI